MIFKLKYKFLHCLLFLVSSVALSTNFLLIFYLFNLKKELPVRLLKQHSDSIILFLFLDD